MKRPPLRVVRLSHHYDSDYEGFQINFLNPVRRRLIPATRVYVGDTLVVSVNSLGCMGAELEDGAPVIGVFGDSSVQGTGVTSWVDEIAIGPCQPLNAGIEGLDLSGIVDRFFELNAAAPLVCAAVHSGWHNLVYGETGEAHWREQFDRIAGPPVIAHFRLVADFHDDVLTRGYEPFWSETYGRWRFEEAFDTPEGLRRFKSALDRFNAFITAYCAEKGRVLIDVAPDLAPRTYDDIGRNFMDLIHPRPEAYAAIGQSVARQLAPYLRTHIGKASPRSRQPRCTPETVGAGPQGQVGRNYPLW